MNLSMYSGFSDIVRKEGIEAAAKTAKELGFSSVEFLDMQSAPPIIPDLETATKFKRVLTEYGLTVACFSFGITIISPTDPAFPTEEAVDRLLHSAEMAAAVGSPYFHHTLILTLRLDEKNHENDFAKVSAQLLPHVRRVADRCTELGITALYEPQGFYVNGKDRFPEFYRAMKSYCSNVGVCGDIGNPNFCDWKGEDFVTEMAAEIRHVHLKDYKLYPDGTLPQGAKGYRSEKGVAIHPVLMGEGDIDILYCLNTLKKAGYNGALALESEYRNQDEMAKDIAYLTDLAE